VPLKQPFEQTCWHDDDPPTHKKKSQKKKKKLAGTKWLMKEMKRMSEREFNKNLEHNEL